MKIIAKASNFLKEVKIELKKVTWPTKKETTRYTLVVLGVCLGVAIYLGALDFLFSKIRDFIIQ